MVNVNQKVHDNCQLDGARTRARIYFYSGDCTDDVSVQSLGTLLKLDVADVDSNGRISANGIHFSEFFNKEEDVYIGRSNSSQMSATLLNMDGGLNNFTYGKCKIYIDIYDVGTATWYPCPMGVYIVGTPAKRRTSLVAITANDCMDTLNVYCDDWWNGLTFDASTTLYDILDSLATYNSFHLSTATYSNMLNADNTIEQMPFTVNKNTTFRDVVEMIAEASGCNARFDRNGYLELAPFSSASFTVSCDTIPTPCLGIDVAEYSVSSIDYMEAKDNFIGISSTYGAGNNGYVITDNLFIDAGATEDYMDTYCANISSRLFGIPSFVPMNLRLIADYSVQAGDIISVVYGNETYSMPIFQADMLWNGSYVVADYSCEGSAERKLESKSVRSVQELQGNVHKMVNTVEQFSSRFESVEGSVSDLTQTVDGISATVADQQTQISAKLDSASASLTFTALQNSIDANTASIETNQTNLERYIRFINGAIVLGRNDSEIKLKLVNNIIYFFSGADEDDESNAIAYFSNNQLYVINVNTEEHVQIGTETGAENYQFLKQPNGDLILRMV